MHDFLWGGVLFKSGVQIKPIRILKCKIDYFLYSGFGSGGTCPGDSGGPLLTSVEDLETLETKAQQVGVLHGGLEACSNANFPAIYVRLDNPSVHQWLMSQLSSE